MQVASKELSKKLFELSGWGKFHSENVADYFYWHRNDSWRVANKEKFSKLESIGERLEFPAYDLGFLLRKLPGRLPVADWLEIGLELSHSYVSDEWIALYPNRLTLVRVKPSPPQASAGTPEDAVCLLAIKLFKQGILKKEG